MWFDGFEGCRQEATIYDLCITILGYSEADRRSLFVNGIVSAIATMAIAGIVDVITPVIKYD
jgi:hypothetical protein